MNTNIPKIVITIVCIIFLSFKSQSQLPIYRHFDTSSGLPSGSVYKIFQDSKGIIWFATSRGIARFDGWGIKTINDNLEISSQEFFDIYEDEHNRIWFLSYSSFFTYYSYSDDKLHRIYNKASGVDIQPITQMSYSKSKKLYYTNWIEKVINDRHLHSYFTIDENNKIQEIDITIPNQLYPVMKTGSDNIINDLKEFVTSKNGLHYFSYLKHGVLANDNFLAYNEVTNEIISVKDKKILKRRLSEIVPGRKNVLRIKPINKELFCIYFDDGVQIVDQNLVIKTTYDFLSTLNFRNLLIDREKSLWLSSRFEGVYYIKSSDFISKNKELGSQQITHIKKHNNCLFVGNATGEIFELDAYNLGLKRKILNANGFIKNIELSHDGKIMYVVLEDVKCSFIAISLTNEDSDVLKFSDLKIHHEESTKRYYCTPGFKNIYSSERGVVFSSNYGIIFIDKLNEKSKFISTPFRALHAVDDVKRDLIMVGGPSGIVMYDIANNCFLDTEVKQSVNKIILDHKNCIWIWTATNELYKSSDSGLQKLPLPKTVLIKDIYLNEERNPCILTQNSVLSNLAESQPTYHFNNLVDRNIITCTSSQDTFYLGTKAGVIKVVSNTDPLPKFCQVQFNDFQHGDSLNKKFDEIKVLESDEQFFSIEVAFPCYDLNTEIKIKHKLHGYDNEYQETNQSEIKYYNLPAGTFILEVIVENSEGKIISSRSQVIKKLNFWYQSIWFYVIVLFMLVFVLYKLILANINRIEQKNNLRLALYKRMSQSEIAALQNQLNPHFISNVLTSIQSYIVNRSPKEASDYLNSFNRLLRLILESSRNNYLPIRQEIELLKKYLELENLRFHNAIDYKFIIPEELDLNTEIPSMIIQPFVENAIIHGLSGLNYQPKLLLIFENANNILNIYIHDNGHGIIIQKEGNTPKISNHHLSRGNEITKERMTAFSQQGTHLLTLDYIIPPFFNENGKGTSVKLSITFND